MSDAELLCQYLLMCFYDPERDRILIVRTNQSNGKVEKLDFSLSHLSEEVRQETIRAARTCLTMGLEYGALLGIINVIVITGIEAQVREESRQLLKTLDKMRLSVYEAIKAAGGIVPGRPDKDDATLIELIACVRSVKATPSKKLNKYQISKAWKALRIRENKSDPKATTNYQSKLTATLKGWGMSLDDLIKIAVEE